MSKQITILMLLSISMVLQNVAGSGNVNEGNKSEPSPGIVISGTVKNGLRIIPAKIDGSNFLFTVYRGDYMVIDIIDGKSHNLLIPALNIDMNIPGVETQNPYIKMKETGRIEFSIDNIPGIINVIEVEGSRYSELTSLAAFDLIKNIDLFILDVRTEGEYNTGHLENAYLLPVQILKRDIKSIEKYKDKNILIYCHVGNRSTVASKILLDAGFTNIYNLRHGIVGWNSKGYPIVK